MRCSSLKESFPDVSRWIKESEQAVDSPPLVPLFSMSFSNYNINPAFNVDPR